MRDSLRRKRKLADSFIPCPNEFLDHAALYLRFLQPNPNRNSNTPNVNNSSSENRTYWDNAKEPDFQSLLYETAHKPIDDICSPLHENVQILSNYIAENSMKVLDNCNKLKTIVRNSLIRRAHRGIMLSTKMPPPPPPKKKK